MRVGRVRRVAYVKPGDRTAGDLIRALEGRHAAVLLANHGPVVAGKDLASAVYAAEELEETAKLAIMLPSLPTRLLRQAQVAELETSFASLRRCSNGASTHATNPPEHRH